MPVLRLFIGDIIRTRKTHPCGSDQWEIVRLGADIGIRCVGCGRRVLMPRPKLERRIKEFLRRGPAADGTTEGTGAPGRQGEGPAEV